MIQCSTNCQGIDISLKSQVFSFKTKKPVNLNVDKIQTYKMLKEDRKCKKKENINKTTLYFMDNKKPDQNKWKMKKYF